MAVRVIETITCDVCGADASLAHPDVTFRWQGVEYMMDLCDAHFGHVQTLMKGILHNAQRSEVRQNEHRRLKLLAKTEPERLRKLKRGA